MTTLKWDRVWVEPIKKASSSAILGKYLRLGKEWEKVVVSSRRGVLKDSNAILPGENRLGGPGGLG